MLDDWRALCKGSGFRIEGDDVVVTIGSGRERRVQVRETDSAFELRAVVARAAAVQNVDDLATRLWRHNSDAQLAGFRQDARGRVCATGWLPKVGLTGDELQLMLRKLTTECDRLEFLLTGRNQEVNASG
jgi:hypothetical protein